MNAAEAMNDNELMMNAVLYPNFAAVTPPSAAPSVSCKKRVENINTLAVNISCRVIILAIEVFFAASKKVVATGDAIIGFLPNLNDGYPRPWPKTIDSVGAWKFDHIIAGHGSVQHGRGRMSQFRNYIEDLTARVERAKKAGTPLAELQKTITPASLATLQSGGFGAFVADNLEKYTVYLGDRTALEDRLTGNVAAIYNNLDKV